MSIEDIEGTYFYIRKEKEEYTMHTRQVAHTRTKSDGTTETYYTTETYWTWDYVAKEEFNTERFNFLGVDFDYGTIKFSNTEYLETKDGGYHIRYKYYVIPFEFKGSLFTYIENNTITQNDFYLNNTTDTIIKQKQNEETTAKVIFWIIWIIAIGFIDFYYVSLDNYYLED